MSKINYQDYNDLDDAVRMLAKCAVAGRKTRKLSKQAAGFVDSAKNMGSKALDWAKTNPMYSVPLAGAAIGGGIGGATSLAKPKEERQTIRSILRGAMAGGLVGGGGYAADKGIGALTGTSASDAVRKLPSSGPKPSAAGGVGPVVPAGPAVHAKSLDEQLKSIFDETKVLREKYPIETGSESTIDQAKRVSGEGLEGAWSALTEFSGDKLDKLKEYSYGVASNRYHDAVNPYFKSLLTVDAGRRSIGGGLNAFGALDTRSNTIRRAIENKLSLKDLAAKPSDSFSSGLSKSLTYMRDSMSPAQLSDMAMKFNAGAERIPVGEVGSITKIEFENLLKTRPAATSRLGKLLGSFPRPAGVGDLYSVLDKTWLNKPPKPTTVKVAPTENLWDKFRKEPTPPAFTPKTVPDVAVAATSAANPLEDLVNEAGKAKARAAEELIAKRRMRLSNKARAASAAASAARELPAKVNGPANKFEELVNKANKARPAAAQVTEEAVRASRALRAAPAGGLTGRIAGAARKTYQAGRPLARFGGGRVAAIAALAAYIAAVGGPTAARAYSEYSE